MNNEIVWRPSGDYLAKTNIHRFMAAHGFSSYGDLVRRSVADIRWFWDACQKDLGIEWYEPYTEVLDDSCGFAWCRWFSGGKINLVHNCLDRHALAHSSRIAVLWEGDNGETRQMSYGELNYEVCRLASALRDLGLRRGDAVGLYMPMVPEIVAALMAVWKIGAVAVPIFSGFGPEALSVRLRDAGVRVLFTADGFFRRGETIHLKKTADQGLYSVASVKTVIVLKRTGISVPWSEGRDVWWEDFVHGRPAASPTTPLESEDRAIIIYTSGTTGLPKGTIHTHAGTLVTVARELSYYFDVKPEDRFFWLSDIGWMMGPWEIIGIGFLGATLLLFEGAPNWPTPARLWEIVGRYGLSHLGISPTAIRLLKRSGDEWVDRHDLRSLRILGSTGEPWDPESYLWYFRRVGRERCPIINISGGTELMGSLLAGPPITEIKTCSLPGPSLGMDVDVVDEEGKSLRGALGYLVCKKPAPSMTRGFLNDPQRYLDTYFSRWPNVWYHGDWARVDEDGFWFLPGRADDTIKVAGKRTGPAEIESALLAHSAVAESAAIGVPDELKGESVVCLVVLKPGSEASDDLGTELGLQVVKMLGKTLLPRRILFVPALPKTRSGKIVRRAIKYRYLGAPPGDLSSVENPEALEGIPVSGAF